MNLLTRHLRIVALLFLTWLLSPGSLTAEDRVPATVEYRSGSVSVHFDPVPGRVYRIEHTTDLVNWTFYPDLIYGLGQNARYHVYEAPVANQTVPPPSSDPQPAEHLFFMVNAFADGSAVATWNGSDGSPARAYLARST